MCGRVDIGAYEHGFGDTNCDGVVDIADTYFGLSCLGGVNAPISTPACLMLDSDADGDVDLADLGAILALAKR